MVTREADIIKKGENYYLELTLADKKVVISLTEDNQNEVKDVFNDLILDLKKEQFNFSMDKDENNLYYQISKEYITQLNSEMNAVYTELVNYGFVEELDNKE